MRFEGTANNLLRAVGKPPFMYGTAWKKDETTRLVKEALASGFVAVDTACQPRHYREDLVGAGLRETFKAGTLSREQVFVQTKYTPPGGQDANNMPYDPSSPITNQVHASIATSLRNLRPSEALDSQKETYIDSLVMHSPHPTIDMTMEAWRTLESYVPHKIKHLGISNTSLPILEAIYDAAEVKPSVVQMRFYPGTKYDVPLRKFCREKGIVYQSFWTLTGNPKLLKSQPVLDLSQKVGVSQQIALYSLVMGLEVAVLNGTTNRARMTEDLEGVAKVQQWTQSNDAEWENLMGGFRDILESVA